MSRKSTEEENFKKMKSELISLLGIKKIIPTKVTEAESCGQLFYNKNVNWLSRFWNSPLFCLDCEFGILYAHTPDVYQTIIKLYKKYKLTTFIVVKNYRECKY